MTVLITRPLQAAERTQALFQLNGISTWIEPVLTICPLPITLDLDTYDAIIATSTAGIDSLAPIKNKHKKTLFCVGESSARLARKLGFHSVHHPQKPGGEELAHIIKQSNFKRFAYIRGEIVKIDMAHTLRDTKDIHVDSYITYKAKPTLSFSDKTLDLFHDNKITAITFYSDHSARIIIDLLRKHDLLSYTASITALCLSESIYDAIKAVMWKNVGIGSTSHELVANLLKTHRTTMELINDRTNK